MCPTALQVLTVTLPEYSLSTHLHPAGAAGVSAAGDRSATLSAGPAAEGGGGGGGGGTVAHAVANARTARTAPVTSFERRRCHTLLPTPMEPQREPEPRDKRRDGGKRKNRISTSMGKGMWTCDDAAGSVIATEYKHARHSTSARPAHGTGGEDRAERRTPSFACSPPPFRTYGRILRAAPGPRCRRRGR